MIHRQGYCAEGRSCARSSVVGSARGPLLRVSRARRGVRRVRRHPRAVIEGIGRHPCSRAVARPLAIRPPCRPPRRMPACRGCHPEQRINCCALRHSKNRSLPRTFVPLRPAVHGDVGIGGGIITNEELHGVANLVHLRSVDGGVRRCAAGDLSGLGGPGAQPRRGERLPSPPRTGRIAHSALAGDATLLDAAELARADVLTDPLPTLSRGQAARLTAGRPHAAPGALNSDRWLASRRTRTRCSSVVSSG